MVAVRICLAAGLLIGSGLTVKAGDPFVTDDPETTEPGHVELTVAGTYSFRDGEAEGELPSLEINTGLLPGLEFHVVLPLAYDRSGGSGTRFGLGDVELGIRYRFLDQTDDSWLPAAAFFPLVQLPSGNEERGLGTGHAHVFLPVWLQRDFAPWTIFGGGGYWINPGEGNKDWWFFGTGITRKLTENLSAGVELFHSSPDTEDAKSATGFNVGVTYEVTEGQSLLISAGRGLDNADETNRFSAYLGYELTF